ncbi:MAG: hypothetical protein QMD61_00290 [Methanobacterium sp.]|nr:hypothetical protein [Methanobacterium sp.]
MNFNKYKYKILLLIPAITMFFIALIPTLKYQWPLSWDIIYHVQYAKIYAHYGFVLENPLVHPSQKIGYPPLFHLLLASLATGLKIDYFDVAKFLQPILAASIVLSVSYIAKEFYGKIAGISAGFLIISSYLIHRIILPIPENLALIFLPISIYFYYRSIKEGVLKYAFIAGFIFAIIISIHLAAPLCLFLIITAFTLFELVWNKNINVLKNYGAFLVILITLSFAAAIGLAFLRPDVFHSIIQQGLSTVMGYSTSLTYNKSMSTLGYFGSLGAMILIFTAIGGITALKKMQKEHMFIFAWIITMFLLSKAYWFGINVISYRVLIYLLIPLSIFSGFGLSHIYYKLKYHKRFSSTQFRSLFLISIFILCTFFGVLTIENPKITKFGAQTEFGYIQIAPPRASEVDLMEWFNENGDRNKSIITNNLYSGMLISSKTLMPLHYGFIYLNNQTPPSFFEKEKIGYMVFDKRLTFQSKNESIYLKKVRSEFYPLFYFSKDIKSNIKELIPEYAEIVYENKDFIVCKIVY